MINIPISNIPNQSLSIVLDDNNYTIRLHTCNNIVAVDIVRNSETIVSGMRATCGTSLIPYSYLQDGNFIFVTQNDEYPNYNLFGLTQFLIYASLDEITEINSV
jgi:hypothetical protein